MSRAGNPASLLHRIRAIRDSLPDLQDEAELVRRAKLDATQRMHALATSNAQMLTRLQDLCALPLTAHGDVESAEDGTILSLPMPAAAPAAYSVGAMPAAAGAAVPLSERKVPLDNVAASAPASARKQHESYAAACAASSSAAAAPVASAVAAAAEPAAEDKENSALPAVERSVSDASAAAAAGTADAESSGDASAPV